MPHKRVWMCAARLRELNENCLECICDDTRGMGCDVSDLCGTGSVSGACDLLDIEEEYWEKAGRPMVEALQTDERYGRLKMAQKFMYFLYINASRSGAQLQTRSEMLGASGAQLYGRL